MTEKALVLFSGGLDSTVCLWWAMNKYGRENVEAMHFEYGQQSREHEAFDKIMKLSGVKATWIRLNALGGNNLTGVEPKVYGDLPPSYVPARNLIFLSIAANHALVYGFNHLVIGANDVDFGGYPDCRPKFFRKLRETFDAGLPEKLGIDVPLQRLNKKEIVKMGNDLGAPIGQSWSCYKGGNEPCGTCPACINREKGFK
jgi:7-cyano-7-deazaguanine synthase